MTKKKHSQFELSWQLVPWGRCAIIELQQDWPNLHSEADTHQAILNFTKLIIPSAWQHGYKLINLQGQTNSQASIPNKRDLLTLTGGLSGFQKNVAEETNEDEIKNIPISLNLSTDFQSITPDLKFESKLSFSKSVEIPDFVNLSNVNQFEAIIFNQALLNLEVLGSTFLSRLLKTPPILRETLFVEINSTGITLKVKSAGWYQGKIQPLKSYGLFNLLCNWLEQTVPLEAAELKFLESLKS